MGKEPLATRLRLLFLLAALFSGAAYAAGPPAPVLVDVGLVLDARDKVGNWCRASVEMGFRDFYEKHPNYTTRVALHFRDSGNTSIGAASAALNLLENADVKAILGPLKSTQASFLIALGNKYRVPLISFSVTSPSLSPTESPYFIRTSLNSSSQVDAIASFVKAFSWREVVLIYEDTEFGSSLLPYLNDALQGVDALVAYRSVLPFDANANQIGYELKKLKALQTRVFIVHMLKPVGSLLFQKAKELGMISEGYVWISTNGMVDLWDPLDNETVNSMQGVVGFKPYVPDSAELRLFRAQWKATHSEDPIIYCQWAYDSAHALAMAIENVHTRKLNFGVMHGVNGMTGLAKLGVSVSGLQLLKEIQNTNFHGISGGFRIIDGQLQISYFQIVNMIGKTGKHIGFWSKTGGFAEFLNSAKSQNYSRSLKDLGSIIWPGGINFAPKGWEIPTKGNVLKIGVPVKKGFFEFVNATSENVTGYCIDVFKAVIELLPYQVDYHFHPYKLAQDPGSYDDLVSQVLNKKFDAVIGDVTIRSNRSLYVDFTLPYTESGVAMLVPIKENANKNAWIFLKPLTWKLWVVCLFAFLFIGFVIWVLEHQSNDEFRGPPSHEAGTVFYFAFKTMFFAHSERLINNSSRIVIVVWIFAVLILTSSYTASLSSMLTFQQMQPAITNVNELLKNKDYVGYQDGSFVRNILKELKFDDSRIRNYSNLAAYANALDKGSRNGGIAAIFDEIPYIKLFLNGSCSKYTMVPLKFYKAAGFGFVFPKGSPLLPDISRAILNVTQGETMHRIEEKWFGSQTDCSTDANAVDSNKLQFGSFWGLFLITGLVTVLCLIASIVTYFHENWADVKSKMASVDTRWKKLNVLCKHYCSMDEKSHTFRRSTRATTMRHDAMSARTADDASPYPQTLDGSFSPFTRTANGDASPRMSTHSCQEETAGHNEPDDGHNGIPMMGKD